MASRYCAAKFNLAVSSIAKCGSPSNAMFRQDLVHFKQSLTVRALPGPAKGGLTDVIPVFSFQYLFVLISMFSRLFMNLFQQLVLY